MRGMNTTEQLTRLLLKAYDKHTNLLSAADNGPVDTAQAYAVQAEVWRQRVGKGRPHVWKVGTTGKTAEPVAAPIFPMRFSVSPGEYQPRGICSIGVEAEIAVRFGRSLPARPEPYGREEILTAIGSLHVAMEVVDARLHDTEYSGPLWCLADNLLNGALILGDEIAHWREQDWQGRRVTITADDNVLDERIANPPLDDLFHCLPWWIAHAGGAREGDIVTTGAWTGMHPIGQAGAISVAFAGLGECRAAVRGLENDYG